MDQQFQQRMIAAVSYSGRKADVFSTADPIEWRTWRQNFEMCCEINRWGDGRARREACASMKGVAKQYTEDIPINAEPTPGRPAIPAVPAIAAVAGAPAVPAVPAQAAIPAADGQPAVPAVAAQPAIPAVLPVAGWPGIPAQPAVPAIPVAPVAELLDLYEARFCPAADNDLARMTLRDSKQSESETILAWHARARHLFKRAYPQLTLQQLATHRDLMDTFILGLFNTEIRQETWRARPLTYALCLDSAQNCAAGLQVMKRAADSTDPAVFNMDAQPSTAAIRGRCYTCNKPGHYERDCQQRRKVQDRRRRGNGNGGQRGSRGRGGRQGYSRGRGNPRGGFGSNRNGDRNGYRPRVSQMDADYLDTKDDLRDALNDRYTGNGDEYTGQQGN